MTDEPTPDWVIKYLEIGESVPGHTFSVLVAESGEAEGSSLDMQSMLYEPSEQNVRLGLDSYCVVNDSGGVHYGGLEEVSLLTDSIVLRFTDEAAEELGLPSNVVTLAIDPHLDTGELRDGLQKVLTYGNPEQVPTLNM